MSKDTISFSDWFDFKNVDHIKALDNLMRNGVWPDDFIPENVTFNPNWYYMVIHSFVVMVLSRVATGQWTL